MQKTKKNATDGTGAVKKSYILIFILLLQNLLQKIDKKKKLKPGTIQQKQKVILKEPFKRDYKAINLFQRVTYTQKQKNALHSPKREIKKRNLNEKQTLKSEMIRKDFIFPP